MFVAGIGCLEAERTGVDLEHVRDDLGQIRFEDAGSLVDAVASMKADPIGRNAAERCIGRFDVNLRLSLLLPVVKPWLDEDVRQEWIVHLHQNAGGYDRAIFLVQLGSERVEVLFLALVVFVDADARGCSGRQKHLMVRHACGLGSGLHIGDIDLQFCLALIFHRGGADDGNNWQNGAAHHRFLEVLGIVFGKSGDFLLENSELLIGSRLEPIEALADVSEKARLGIFAVGYDLNAALYLLAHAFSNLPRQDRIQLALIIWLPRVLCFQQIEQIVRPWQAADMRGLDVIGILLDGHRSSSEFTVEKSDALHLKMCPRCVPVSPAAPEFSVRGFRFSRPQAREPAADGAEFGLIGRRQRADRRAPGIRERGFGRFFTPSTTRRANSPLMRSIATSSLRYQFATALAIPRMPSTARRVSRSVRNSPCRTPSLRTSSNTRSSPRDHFPIRRRLSLGRCWRSFKNTRTQSLRSVNGAKCDLIKRASLSAAVPGPDAIALATSKYPATPCWQTSSSPPSLEEK